MTSTTIAAQAVTARSGDLEPVSLPGLLDSLTLPQLQVTEALAALGPTSSLADLSRLLTGNESDVRVSNVLEQLRAVGLCEIEDDLLITPPGLRRALGRPLGLGPLLAEALNDLYADDVRRIAQQLGLPALGRKEVTVGLVLERLREPGVIEALLADAPYGVIDRLLAMAGCVEMPLPTTDADEDWEFDRQWQPRYRDEPSGRYGYLEDHAWARVRGLVVSGRDDGRAIVPAEIAMVLRGPNYRAPFDPERPAVNRQLAVAPSRQEGHMTGRVAGEYWLRMTQLCAVLLDEVARKPLPKRRSGQLTDTEVKRLGSTLEATPDEVRVLLALATAGRLVAVDTSAVEADRQREWLNAEIPERAAILARQIRTLARPLCAGESVVPGVNYGPRPKPRPGVRDLRPRLLGVMAELPPGEPLRLESVQPLVRWEAPRAIDTASDTMEELWREAEALALIVDGSLSPVGRALLDADDSQLSETFERLFPAIIDETVICADLTATVTGLPSRRVSCLLDSLASRESVDVATTWRFSTSSVRRAFDGGETLHGLTTRLDELSRTPLPDTLTRLLADVARRHGHLVVTPTGSVIESGDAALLVELLNSPELGPLGLRVLTSGVLMSGSSGTRTLEVLRDNGYLPVPAVPIQG